MFRPLPPRPAPPKIWDSCPKLSDATRRPRTSLWKGPVEDGITYSLLCKFINCPERFRLQAVEGLKEPWGWKYQAEYGTMFHHAMEAADGGKPWKPAIQKYYQELLGKYPANEGDITKWYMFACMQFPIYLKHWENHETQKNRKMLYEEEPFGFHHTWLGSGSETLSVKLRGKLDCAFSQREFIKLQENKTKGEIDQEGISRTVDQNLQTMIYHLALRSLLPEKDHKRIAGTLYNVIRRPLSDRNSPRQKKKETLKQFVERVGGLIQANPNHHFFRWSVSVLPRHINTFKRETLNPLLRWLCMWWDSIKDDPFDPFKNGVHFRYPFGVYHSMGSGFRGDYFRYFTEGSTAGLERITDLFPEVH